MSGGKKDSVAAPAILVQAASVQAVRALDKAVAKVMRSKQSDRVKREALMALSSLGVYTNIRDCSFDWRLLGNGVSDDGG